MNFSNKIVSLGDSFFISIVSIISVFFMLLVISYLIDAVAKLLSTKFFKNNINNSSLNTKTNNSSVIRSSGNKIDSKTLAIISCAVDAFIKDKNYKIKSIK